MSDCSVIGCAGRQDEGREAPNFLGFCGNLQKGVWSTEYNIHGFNAGLMHMAWSPDEPPHWLGGVGRKKEYPMGSFCRVRKPALQESPVSRWRSQAQAAPEALQSACPRLDALQVAISS